MKRDLTSLWRLGFWVALVVSYTLALLPQEMAPQIGRLSDKTIHFYAFGVLTLLLWFAYRLRYRVVAVWLLGYAVLIELSQYFTANRSAEVLDVVADVIGIGMGVAVLRIVGQIGGRDG